MDRFSPVAPAQIRVLVLPVGQVERTRYLAFLDRLKTEVSIVPLAELENYTTDNDLSLSPKKFPNGSLFYNYTVSAPSDQQQQLSPFELFREPLMVLGVKDGLVNDEFIDKQELWGAAEYLRGRHPRVVHRQLLLLEDRVPSDATIPDNVIRVSNISRIQDSSLREAAYQFSVRFLKELGTSVQAMQASPSIQTPGQTARRLQRTISLRERERQTAGEFNSPSQSIELSRPVDMGEDVSRSPPPTSFDQMTNTNGGQNPPRRPESRQGNKSKNSARASSQERVSMQGFGSVIGTSHDKVKARGKARVGIVVGYLYLMAGQWSEALRMFVDHDAKSRVLSDLLWHAKALEGAVVCMLLHLWARVDFQIPAVCYAASGGPTPANGSRFSVDISSQFRSTDSQQLPVGQLSNMLPSLLGFILGLYNSGEGSIELPFVSIADVTIRFSKLLVILRNYGGELTQDALASFIEFRTMSSSKEIYEPSGPPAMVPLKCAIADMLSYADPSEEENIAIADHAAILAGAASVYALLRMHRKKAITVKNLTVKLTGALIQARKRGAAEMGMHPAATLTSDTGANSVLSLAEEIGGLNQLMSEVASTYGIRIPNASPDEAATHDPSPFGNYYLKLSFIRALAAFYEASPDPRGVMLVNASMLKEFGPNGAVDGEPNVPSNVLSKEEQMRCITSINRTIGVSKLLRLPEPEAAYWDEFLVRDVEFIPANPDQAVADLAKMKQAQASGKNPDNPLIYDPHANRPRTADEVQQTSILLPNEVSSCRVTLQNPYEVPVNVENLRVVTEGVDLNASLQRFTLSPFGIQRVSVPVSPAHSGDCKVTGCIIKIEGCREKFFPIFREAWTPSTPTIIKELGQDREVNAEVSKDLLAAKRPGPGFTSVTVIDPQPMLVIDDSSLIDSTLMLLDGEICELEITLKNISNITASVFDIVTTNDAVQLQDDSGEDGSSDGSAAENEQRLVGPGERITFTFDVVGKPSILQVRVAFHYSAQSNATHARIFSVPINMTVNAGLQVQNLDAIPLDIALNGEYSFVLSLDVGNAWPKSLFYSCFVSDLGLKSAEPRRCHNHEDVLAPGQVQRVFMPVARPLQLNDNDSDGDVLEVIRRDLLSRLRIIWNVEGEERMREVDVSALAMTTEVRKIIAGEAIRVTLEIVELEEESVEKAKNTVKAGSFATLRAKLWNRTAHSYPLLVRLQSKTLNSSDSTVSEKQLAIAGTEHRFVPGIAEGGTETIDFTLCPLLAGMIELEVMVTVALPKDENRAPWSSHENLTITVV